MSKRRHEGYLMVDHRMGPGVTQDFIHSSGKDTPLEMANRLYETATVTCSHCNRVIILNPLRDRPRQYCAKCDHYVCDTLVCTVSCKPLKQLFDELEKLGAQLLKGE